MPPDLHRSYNKLGCIYLCTDHRHSTDKFHIWQWPGAYFCMIKPTGMPTWSMGSTSLPVQCDCCLSRSSSCWCIWLHDLHSASDQLPVLIDTMCWASFQNLLDCPNSLWMDWVAYQAGLKDRLPANPVVNDKEAIHKGLEELTSVIQEVIAASVPKHWQHANPLLPLSASIQDEIHLKEQLKTQWQVMRDPALKAWVNHL